MIDLLYIFFFFLCWFFVAIKEIFLDWRGGWVEFDISLFYVLFTDIPIAVFLEQIVLFWAVAIVFFVWFR